MKHLLLAGIAAMGMILVCACSAPVFAESIDVTISVPPVSLQPSLTGVVPRIPGYGLLKEPGAPMVPARIISVAIPPGATVQNVSLRSKTVRQVRACSPVAPVPVPRAICEDDPGRSAAAEQLYEQNFAGIYNQKGYYPSSPIELVRTAWLRRYNLVDIRVMPVQYDPVASRLTILDTLTLTVEFTPDSQPVNPSLMLDRFPGFEARAEALIVNYREAQVWYPSGPMSRGLYEYVIITTSALQGAVTDLANWEMIKGKTANVVTVDWISSNYTGVDLAQKMRNFLRDKYPAGEWGITDVCFIGHHSQVPMRQIYDDPDTDYYFAELSLPDSESWDANSNGQYLDSGDSCDFYSEINVGRIPWSDSDIVLNVCEKSIQYEMMDDPSYKKNALLLGAFFWSDTDNAVLMEAKVDQPWMADWTLTRMYEQNSSYYSTYPCDYELLHSNAVAQWSAGTFAFVNYAGHGSEISCHILGNGAPAFIEASDCTGLNDDYPAIVFADACSNSDTNYINIGARMIEQGAVGFVGATRVAYGCSGWDSPDDGSSQSLDYYFSTSVMSGDSTQGAALQFGLQQVYQMNGWYYNELEMCEWSLWGNPDLGMSMVLSSDGRIMFDSQIYAPTDTAVTSVRDLDLNLDPGTAETVQVDLITSEGDSETLTLTETGIATSVFESPVSIVPGTPVPGNGIMEVSHGAVLTARYIDADDGHGGTNIEKTVDADIDGVPPVISDVTVTSVAHDRFTVTWQTDELADSRLYYGESTPDILVQDSVPSTEHAILVTELDNCTDYVFYVVSNDMAGNSATDDNGGSYYTVQTYALMVLYDADMSADPGWSTEGLWAWGVPQGTGGDPSSGFTGDHVMGYNLNGLYENSLPVRYATTPGMDCSGAGSVTLSFYQWLGVESSSYDHASVEVSGDNGSSWTAIWNHTGATYNPGAWEYMEYDVTDWAAGQSQVKFRWSMGPTDSIMAYCGWNIDDVIVSFAGPCNVPILYHAGHIIDDTAGNSDGLVNPGEEIDLLVTLGNQGTSATGVSAVLSTGNPNVSITQNTSSYPDIPQSGAGTSLVDYTFTVQDAAADGEQIPFVLSWTSNESSGQASFTETVRAPVLDFSQVLIDDTAGDDDGVLDPGETAVVLVSLTNTGSCGASAVSAVLSSSHPQYIAVTTSTANFPDIPAGASGQCQAPYFVISADPATPDHTMITMYLAVSAGHYSGTTEFEMEATHSTFARRFSWPMTTDPGWSCEGDWAWGQPQGNDGDPASGYTGDTVYGYNLMGAYPDDLPATCLTTPPLDCSGFFSTELRFQRWLGVESSTWDHAKLEISTDGTAWTVIWQNSTSTIQDTEWHAMSYDISPYADGMAEVYLRWVMGPVDDIYNYCGWNLDDIEIWAESGEAPVTPTPTSTATQVPPTPTDTPEPPTPTPSPSPVIPTETPTPVVTPGIYLALDDTDLTAGDTFHLWYELYNPDAESYQGDLWILLEVYGEFWCFPSWCSMHASMDYMPDVDVPPGGVTDDVLNFEWPSVSGSADGLHLFGALFEPGGFVFIGELQVITWGYH